MNASALSIVGDVLGRFHPLVLHLPIGLLAGLALLEIRAFVTRTATPRSVFGFVAAAGALFAIASAATGGATLPKSIENSIGLTSSIVAIAAAASPPSAGRQPLQNRAFGGSDQSLGARVEIVVFEIEGRDQVFVHRSNGFQAQPVTVGARSGGRVEIVDKIKPGAVIATRGAFVLKSQLGASEEEE